MTKMTANTAADIQPAATLTEEDGFVLGIFESGTVFVDFAAYVVRRTEDGYIHDHFGDGVQGETGQTMVGWMPIPFDDDAVREAIAAAKEAEAAKTSVLEGDMNEHLTAASIIIHDMFNAESPRRGLMKLHAHLGDNRDGTRIPADAPAELHRIRGHLTNWVDQKTSDEDAAQNLLGEVML